jgi:hypothetical protein
MMKPFILGTAMLALAAPAQAQDFSVVVAPDYRSFSLDESLAAKSASLMMLPIAVSVPLGRSFEIDAYAAYASGRVETSTGDELSIDGPVDTQLRGTWAALPWARLTVGVNVPTGNGTHSTEEAQVAALLSTDLLGFREARFGTGFGVTTGVAAAHQLGSWALGYGASYRMAGEFEPSEDTSTVYSPGDEIMARVALDRNVGSGGKLTLGGTFQHFSDDEFGDNLFTPGMRVRGDASYAFRASAATTMMLFVTDLWREQGEVSLLDDPDASATIGSQNVIILGGGANFGGLMGLSPRADVRLLSHEDGAGSGWIAGVGTGIDVGVASVELTPRGRVLFGSLESDDGESYGLSGFEVELIARF